MLLNTFQLPSPHQTLYQTGETSAYRNPADPQIHSPGQPWFLFQLQCRIRSDGEVNLPNNLHAELNCARFLNLQSWQFITFIAA